MPEFRVEKISKHQVENVLIDELQFSPDNIVFGEVEERSIPGSNVKFQKILLYYEFKSGIFTPLYMNTPPDCYSFGIQDQKNLTNKDITDGFSLPLCVYNVKAPTPEEIRFLEIFETIVNKCRQFLCSAQGEEHTGKKLAMHQLEKLASSMNYPLLPAVPNNKKRTRDPNKGPIFYPKLKTYRDPKTGNFRIDTVFFDVNNKDTTNQALDIYRQHVRAEAVVLLDSIFIGATDIIRLQTRLHEARIAPISKSTTRFLAHRPPMMSQNLAQITDGDENNDSYNVEFPSPMKFQ